MIRICTSLTEAGYKVTLVGFKRGKSKPLTPRPYQQVRIPILAEQGKLLYGGYWIMLFFYLLFKRCDALCAIDLDTIMPVYLVSIIRNKKRVYDAHELFTELKEVVTKPREKKIWDWIERTTLPNFNYNYTVGHYCALYFNEKYNKNYAVVRNATVLKPFTIPERKKRYILYQGWVNEGRCFEQLIPAMRHVDMQLIVCGEGNFFEQAKALTVEYGLQDKIQFKGFLPPDELKQYTEQATIGLTLFHAVSLSNEYSLANRYFDYMHNAVPQVCMNFPEYREINANYEIAVLVNDPATEEDIAAALNKLITDKAYYEALQQNCMNAREQYCWQNEEKILLKVYEEVFAHQNGRS
ncbi:MAG: glycosyltransferase [Chitinophagales bacterium]|nr:glycosyltransferase [Chitinophagales bacterium]